MEEIRVVNKKTVRSDKFLDMPASARLLYYDLAVERNDDGIVENPKSIMRMTGASDDDMAILVDKLFVIPFNTGLSVK